MESTDSRTAQTVAETFSCLWGTLLLGNSDLPTLGANELELRCTVDPINTTIEKWKNHLRGKHPGGLDDLLADDVAFLSPIVFTPQRGKEITKMYLNAAFNTLGDEESNSPPTDSADDFHYIKEVLTGHHAVLEFETKLEGKYINGVDIISCNDDGKIVEFKVMIRPLQAVNLMHQKMAAMLESMKG